MGIYYIKKMKQAAATAAALQQQQTRVTYIVACCGLTWVLNAAHWTKHSSRIAITVNAHCQSSRFPKLHKIDLNVPPLVDEPYPGFCTTFSGPSPRSAGLEKTKRHAAQSGKISRVCHTHAAPGLLTVALLAAIAILSTPSATFGLAIYVAIVFTAVHLTFVLPGKKDKMRLMDGMIQLVVDTLGLETRPAKGSDIVVGQECTATNKFLQLLALAAHCHQQKCREQQTHELEQGQQQVWSTGGDDGESWKRWAELTAGKHVALAAATSEDGVTWEEVVFVGRGGDGGEPAENINGGGRNNLKLKPATTTVRCRHLRLTSPTGGRGSGTTKPCNIGTTSNTSAASTPRGFSNIETIPAAPAFDPGTPTSEHGANSGSTAVVGLNAFRVRVLGAGEDRDTKAAGGSGVLGEEAGERHGRQCVASGVDRNGVDEKVQDGRRKGEKKTEITPDTWGGNESVQVVEIPYCSWRAL